MTPEAQSLRAEVVLAHLELRHAQLSEEYRDQQAAAAPWPSLADELAARVKAAARVTIARLEGMACALRGEPITPEYRRWLLDEALEELRAMDAAA